MTSICYYLVAYNLLGQTMDIAVTALGPFSLSFCTFRRLTISVLNFQAVLLTTAISVVKYVYIFVLKFPPYSKEEFWWIFINLWTLMCSCLSHFVYQFLPGRSVINIYVCSGSFDRELIGTPAKINLFSRYVFIMAVIWYIFSAVRIYR